MKGTLCYGGLRMTSEVSTNRKQAQLNWIRENVSPDWAVRCDATLAKAHLNLERYITSMLYFIYLLSDDPISET